MRIAEILKKKTTGGAVIILSGASDPIHFKSLLFDPQYRFNPYCDRLWFKNTVELWKKFLENDEKAYFFVGIDPPQDFEFLEKDEEEIADNFFKAWANHLAEVVATFYPAGVRLVTPYAEIETPNAENPELNPEVLIKVIIQNFTAKDYHTLFDKLEEVLKPFGPKVKKLPEPELYFDDLKGLIKGTGKFEETEWDHCYHVAEKLAGVEDIKEPPEGEKPKSLKEIRERFWTNPFRVWWEEAHFGRSLPKYYKLESIEEFIDFDAPLSDPVVSCPKCGKLIRINKEAFTGKMETFQKRAREETAKALRKHLIGFKPSETLALPCGHAKEVDATTVKEVALDGKTYCPVCRKWISVPDNWKLPPKLKALKEEIRYKSLVSVPENLQRKIYTAECGCYLTPEEWKKLFEKLEKRPLVCPVCLKTFSSEDLSFEDKYIKTPCGHKATLEAFKSINDKAVLREALKRKLAFLNKIPFVEENVKAIKDFLKTLEQNLNAVLFVKHYCKELSFDFENPQTLEIFPECPIGDLIFFLEEVSNLYPDMAEDIERLLLIIKKGLTPPS